MSSPARAEQAMPDEPGYKRLFALNLDAGFAVDVGAGKLLTTGALGAGLTLWNGHEFWNFTGDVGGMLGERIMAAATVENLVVNPGVGAHGSLLYDLTNQTPGIGGGVSFHIVHLTGMVFFDDPLAMIVYVHLRLPLGFIGYLAASGR